MDEGVLVEITWTLHPEKYTCGQIIIEKDKTLEKMLFIVDGRVAIVNATHSMWAFGAGDFYGDAKLLVAPLRTSSGDAKPIINESVQALDDVQALVLYATDMENLGSSSKRVVSKFMKRFSNFASPSDIRLTWLKKGSCSICSATLLKDMDEGVLREISEKLKPEKYTRGEIIINKDETLEMMLFIVDGHVTIEKENSQLQLGAQDFYGEKLPLSVLWTSSSDAKPINESVQAIGLLQSNGTNSNFPIFFN
ncbi:hypothetical protein L3X38_014124 [Prunus dulcis]|uniref:Cyclic nucleotide-binding domain-containing protein n=1 Tax=Prunus dulcis TaxID=3755 RepID=A0AAD4WMM8_PRUDU|nr:hypothetical protein L3X38_014124 [Prunus dulcis]